MFKIRNTKRIIQKIKCFFGFHNPKSTGEQSPMYPYKRYLFCKFCDKKYRDRRREGEMDELV